MTAKLVEYMATTRLGERGTMTLPNQFRDALKLETGAPITILRIDDGLVLIPEQKRFDQLCDSIATSLENTAVTKAALQATLPAVRQQLTRQHYPELFGAKRLRPTRSKRAPKRDNGSEQQQSAAQVAKRSGLQIGTPADFFRVLSQGLS